MLIDREILINIESFITYNICCNNFASTNIFIEKNFVIFKDILLNFWFYKKHNNNSKLERYIIFDRKND